MGAAAVVARAALHRWEEPCISGTRGSGTVFFAGCALRCGFCQNRKISREGLGREVTPPRLREIMRGLVAQGAHNINLVTPSHFVEPILEALEDGPGVPVVWNSSGYELPETIRRLAGKVDVFLPDWKYGLSGPALRFSGAEDYSAVAREAIRVMAEIAGQPRWDAEGLLVGGVLVRHLVLPGELDNTRAVIDAFAEEFRGRALFSLMRQFVPREGAEPSRSLTRAEYRRMAAYLENCGIKEGYLQEEGADDPAYIPAFDLTGV